MKKATKKIVASKRDAKKKILINKGKEFLPSSVKSIQIVEILFKNKKGLLRYIASQDLTISKQIMILEMSIEDLKNKLYLPK